MAFKRGQRIGGGAHDQAPQLASELATVTDTLNESLARAEEALAALGLGVSASVVLESEPETEWAQYLAFRKDGAKWQLFVDTVTGDEHWKTTPLTSVSREVRKKAALKLDDLYRELLAEAEREVAQVRQAVEAVEEFSDRITGRQDSEAER